jgi:hypothetical protein
MYNFDTLYKSYASIAQDCGAKPSVQDFLDESSAMIASRLQDGEDPRPQDLFVIEYALANNL